MQLSHNATCLVAALLQVGGLAIGCFVGHRAGGFCGGAIGAIVGYLLGVGIQTLLAAATGPPTKW